MKNNIIVQKPQLIIADTVPVQIHTVDAKYTCNALDA